MKRVIGPTRDERRWGGGRGRRQAGGGRGSKPTGEAANPIDFHNHRIHKNNTICITVIFLAHLVGLADLLTIAPGSRGGHRVPVWILITNGAHTRPHQALCHVRAIQRPHNVARRLRSHSGRRLGRSSGSVRSENGIGRAHVQSSGSSQTRPRGESSKGRRGGLCRCPRGGVLAERLVGVARVGNCWRVGEVRLDTAVVDHAVCATTGVGANRVDPVASLGRFASQGGSHGRDRRRGITSQEVLVTGRGRLVAHH